jgi:hypothetical protein
VLERHPASNKSMAGNDVDFSFKNRPVVNELIFGVIKPYLKAGCNFNTKSLLSD